MAERTLGFGLVGTGMIADFHARAIREARGARLVGVAGHTVEGARAFAEKQKIPFAAASVAELLAHPEIDVVCILTPSGVHREPALAAIRAKKHLIIEKPIDATVEGTDEILRAAAEAGVVIGSIFQARFGAGAQAIKAAIDSGRFGRLVLCSAYVKWHRTAAYYTGWKGKLALDGGGALMNQAIHAVDLLQWFAGLPSEVFGWKGRCVHTGIESEDTCIAALKFPDGAMGVIEATTAAWPGWSRRVEICGERGSVVLEDDDIARWEFQASEPGDEAIRASRERGAMGSGASAPNAIGHAGHARQIQDFVDALNTGRAPAIGGREARKAVQLIRAVYESAESGRSVRINA